MSKKKKSPTKKTKVPSLSSTYGNFVTTSKP